MENYKVLPHVEKFFRQLEADGMEYPNELATKYPHIMNSISLFWGEIEILKFFQDLIISDKNRLGFSTTAFNQIYALEEYHSKKYPNLVNKNSDPFSFKFK